MRVLYQITFLPVLLVSLIIGACAHTNVIDDIVNKNKLIKKHYQSSSFSHITLHNERYFEKPASALYVFIEGDGLPWKTRTQISLNPDPLRPLALELMLVTAFPSVYISRPCYLIRDDHCPVQWWTNKRYSKQVVESIKDILHEVSKGFDEVTLVGYSGGGALAALVADSSEDKVTRLVTLAGNMDHLKWAQQHDYSALDGSLNPSDYVLPATVSQFHFAARNDKNILPEWIKAFSDKQKTSQYILLENADHRCCWVDRWKSILTRIDQ